MNSWDWSKWDVPFCPSTSDLGMLFWLSCKSGAVSHAFAQREYKSPFLPVGDKQNGFWTTWGVLLQSGLLWPTYMFVGHPPWSKVVVIFGMISASRFSEWTMWLQNDHTGVQPGKVLSGCIVLVSYVSVLCVQKVGPRTCVPSFSEAALGQVASEGWEPSLQAVLMGAGLTARKFLFPCAR